MESEWMACETSRPISRAALLDRFDPKDFVDLYFLLQDRSLDEIRLDAQKNSPSRSHRCSSEVSLEGKADRSSPTHGKTADH